MLDSGLVEQLRTTLEKIREPIEIEASLGEDAKSAELAELLEEIAGLSERITLRRNGDDARKPSFVIARAGEPGRVGFAGLPLGHEFTSLVLALVQVGGHPPAIDDALAEQIRALPGEHAFETFFSLSCQICPEVVQALNVVAVLNPGFRHTAIDGALFRDEVEARDVLAVPFVFRDEEAFDQGMLGLEEIVARLDVASAAREAEAIAAQAPFEVLVVGGGPAGAAAAIYAARKGIRTGVLAERFGGQLLDTLGIENLIAVASTEGPKLAATLERNVRDHDVEVMNRQVAKALHPPSEPGGWIGLELESGVSLSARSVVLATGARWRKLGVPGEAEYANRGVAYCPHCDGPLFKGKRVAVIGGGNSGVEAAIDLAGITGHVTLIEFDPKLRADEVLVRKLESLPNVTILVHAETTEIDGDDKRVTGLGYRDRDGGTMHRIELEGVFVQIGLLPNTEWLRGAVELSNRGEIVIDERGATNVPGVFAAGDCTTVPYKQIVVALGAGSTAVLSAFDHLVRTPAPATD